MTIQHRIDDARHCSAFRASLIKDAEKHLRRNEYLEIQSEVPLTDSQQQTLNQYICSLDKKINSVELLEQEIRKVKRDIVPLVKIRKNLTLGAQDVDILKTVPLLNPLYHQFVAEASESSEEIIITDKKMKKWFEDEAVEKIESCKTVGEICRALEEIQIIESSKESSSKLSQYSPKYHNLDDLQDSVKNYVNQWRLRRDPDQFLDNLSKRFGTENVSYKALFKEYAKHFSDQQKSYLIVYEISKTYNVGEPNVISLAGEYLDCIRREENFNKALNLIPDSLGLKDKVVSAHKADIEKLRVEANNLRYVFEEDCIEQGIQSENDYISVNTSPNSILLSTLVRYQWISSLPRPEDELLILRRIITCISRIIGNEPVQIEDKKLLESHSFFAPLLQEDIKYTEDLYPIIDAHKADEWFQQRAKSLLETCRTRYDLIRAVRAIQIFKGSAETFTAKMLEGYINSYIHTRLHNTVVSDGRHTERLYPLGTSARITAITSGLGLRNTTLRVCEDTVKSTRTAKQCLFYVRGEVYEIHNTISSNTIKV